MKTTAFLFLLLPLAACASLDIDGARVGFSTSEQRAKNTVDLGDGERVTERAQGTGLGARVELVNVVEPNVEAGLVFGFGEDDIADVGVRNYDVGAAARFYLGESWVRPYAEGRVGYRYAEALVPFADGGHLDMLTAGAALGVELNLGRGVSVFGQGGYEGAFGDGYSSEGLVGTFGLAIRF